MKFKETNVVKNFDYPISCIDMQVSENGNFFTSIGTYKPSVKVHDLVNLSQKSNRHLEAEPTKIIPLTRNAEKLAVLRVDRYVEFHAKYGMHEKIRIPKLCYDMKNNGYKTELLFCGKSTNIYCFDVARGTFTEPYKTSLDSVMCVDINCIHGLIGFCGTNKLEFIDQRVSKIVSSTVHDDDFLNFSFSNNGINFAVGSESGTVKVFDLRSKDYLYTYKHSTSTKKVKMVNKYTISIDKEELKIHTEEELFDCVRYNTPINTFDNFDGVIFLGLDDSKMRTLFCSDFGQIPSWCNFVKVSENL